MNGTFGIVQRRTAQGAFVLLDDGENDEVREADLAKVERGWAIRPRAALVTAIRFLDLYTALTRAQLTAVLVGPEHLIQAAVAAPPSAFRRSVAFRLRLTEGDDWMRIRRIRAVCSPDVRGARRQLLPRVLTLLHDGYIAVAMSILA